MITALAAVALAGRHRNEIRYTDEEDKEIVPFLILGYFEFIGNSIIY